MTFAAPIKVVIRLVVWDTNEETGVAVDPRRQGAGGLLRRDPAHDRERHVHHQRHRARRRLPAAPLAGRVLRSRQGQDPLVGQAALHRPASSRTAARGSTSSSTPRTSSTSASTAAASCTRRCSCARSATRPKSCSTTSTRRRRSSSSAARSTRSRSTTSCSPASAPRATSGTRRRAKSSSRRTASSPRRRSRSCRTRSIDRLPVEVDGSSSARSSAHDVIDENTGEVLLQCNEELTEAKLDELRDHGIDEFKVLFIDNLNVGPYLRDTLHRRQARHARRGDHGDLPPPAPGRSADARDGADAVQQPVLQRRALRPVEGRPPQAELQVQDRRAARELRPHQARHPRDGPLPHRSEERQGRDRRHRSPRQPPRARGRRADGEPVPHRSGSHGARDQRAHEHVSGDRDAHAARPDQRQAGLGGGQGVLRLARSCRSSWTRRTRSRKSRTSVASRRSGPVV